MPNKPPQAVLEAEHKFETDPEFRANWAKAYTDSPLIEYRKQSEMGDTEFKVGVWHRGGPSVAPALNDPTNTWDAVPRELRTGSSILRGLSIHDNYPDSTNGKLLNDDGSVGTKKGAYAIGPDNWTNEIWAHEARHLAHPQMNETSNRVWDAFTAETKKDWSEALDSWRDWLITRDPEKYKDISMSEVEANLNEVLDTNEDRMIALEADYLGLDPSDKAYFESTLKDLRKSAKARKAVRSLYSGDGLKTHNAEIKKIEVRKE